MIVDFFIAFFYIFAVPLKYLPINTGKLILIFLFAFYFVTRFFLVNRLIKSPLEKSEICSEIVLFFCLFGVAIWVALFFAVVKNKYDLSLAYTYSVNLLENFIGSLLLCHYFRYRGYNESGVIFLLLMLMFAQSLIIVFSFFIEPMREFFFSINQFEMTLRDLYRRYGGFRGLGFSGAVTFDLATFLSISFIIVQIYYPPRIRILNKLLLCFTLFVSFFAICITGRTGFFGILLSVVLFMILSIKQKKYTRIWFLMFGVFLFAMFSICIFNMFKSDYPQLEKAYEYTFEIVENKFSGGEGVQTDSTNRLLEMLDVDIAEDTYLFGDGYWLNPNNSEQYYMNIDAGYKRHLLYYGLPITFLVFSIFYALCASIIYKTYKLTNNSNIAIVLTSMLLLFAVVQIKGDFVFGSAMNMKLLFLLLMCPHFTYRKL